MLRKPFSLAFPINTPHIIHTSGSDIMIQIIMRAVTKSLPQNSSTTISIQPRLNQAPMHSLESLSIWNGNFRSADFLGEWTPYANGEVGLLPLSDGGGESFVKHEKISSIKYKEDRDEKANNKSKMRQKNSN